MKRWSDFFTDNSTGGAPFFNQDFYDIQQEFYDAINPTIQNLGKQITNDGNYVVDGLEVTPNGPDWDISAGIVSLGGELYRFNGATAVTSGTKYLAIAADVITNRNYKNGGSKPFFLTKESEVLSSTSGGDEVVFDPSDPVPFVRLSEPIRADGDWITLSLEPGVSVVGGQTPQYRITADESIELRGIVSFASASLTPLFSVPLDYVYGGPADALNIPLAALGGETGTLSILGTGVCNASFGTPSTSTRANLFGIRWSKTL